MQNACSQGVRTGCHIRRDPIKSQVTQLRRIVKNCKSKKIRSRRAVKRPLQVSPSSRCPSGGRFAPYLGSKRSVAGQVPLFERTGTWVNGVQPVTCVLLPGPNWCVPNSSTRCQAFASSSSAILLSEQVPSGCCAPWDGRPSFGGGEGWAGRPLGVLVDVVRAR